VEDVFLRLIAALNDAGVRYVLIGVAGANYYAPAAAAAFVTQDRDLLLPLDPENLLRSWETAARTGLALWCGDEPLDQPRDLALATAIVSRRALVRAVDDRGAVQVDFTLVMEGFDFESVWAERREFRAGGVGLPVARLSHIVHSKAMAGRDKDRLFLATHAEALRQLLHRESG
jgi:hypothetical protein